MGITYRARLQQQTISRRRTQFDTPKDATQEYRTTSGSTGNNQTSKETSVRTDLGKRNEGSMDKAK